MSLLSEMRKSDNEVGWIEEKKIKDNEDIIDKRDK